MKQINGAAESMKNVTTLLNDFFFDTLGGTLICFHVESEIRRLTERIWEIFSSHHLIFSARKQISIFPQKNIELFSFS